MRILFLKGLLAAPFLVVITGICHAATFSDNFNNQNFTSSNWIDGSNQASQTWSSMPLSRADFGWHATAESLSTEETAVKIANNCQEYYNAKLYIRR